VGTTAITKRPPERTEQQGQWAPQQLQKDPHNALNSTLSGHHSNYKKDPQNALNSTLSGHHSNYKKYATI